MALRYLAGHGVHHTHLTIRRLSHASIGLGAAYIRPKADNFVDKRETLMALGAGGGLEITFKKQITLRIDARNWSLFDENKANNGQEYSGGLAIFF